MERLTVKGPSGLISLKDKLENGANQAIKCLSEYEDTGLTPQEIMELKERDTEYFCKTSMFDHESVVCKCGNDIEKDSGFKFCPYCGHRIKLED